MPEESFINLCHLVRLNLQGNKLTQIPESLGNLLQLMELYLSNNELVYIPQSLMNLKLLTVLTLNGNLFHLFQPKLLKENIQITNPLTLEELTKRFIRKYNLQEFDRQCFEYVPSHILKLEEKLIIRNTSLVSNKRSEDEIECPKCGIYFSCKYKVLVKCIGKISNVQQEPVPIQWKCCSFDCAFQYLKNSLTL